MDKRKRSVSLSRHLFRFLLLTGTLMIAVGVLSYFLILVFVKIGWVYPATAGQYQANQFITAHQQDPVFDQEDIPPLVDYLLLDANGKVLESSIPEKKQTDLLTQYNLSIDSSYFTYMQYPDDTTLLLSWHIIAEFRNDPLRNALPPFELLWYGIIGFSLVLCLVLTTLRLRKQLVSHLQLFTSVSEKVGRQELDFDIPKAGITEFDEALHAMDEMRGALQSSLASQWDAQQKQQMEMAALAHDLKTPLTVIGGNAELLLEDPLDEEQSQMVAAIKNNNDRAQMYVASLMETATGNKEEFTKISRSQFLEPLVRQAQDLAHKAQIEFEVSALAADGAISAQPERLQRALGNLLQNAIEHTPPNQSVSFTATIDADQWILLIHDGGDGFSPQALEHATERFWRDDQARSASGHSGLGMWFANQVIQEHGGGITLKNTGQGGLVQVCFPVTDS